MDDCLRIYGKNDCVAPKLCLMFFTEDTTPNWPNVCPTNHCTAQNESYFILSARRFCLSAYCPLPFVSVGIIGLRFSHILTGFGISASKMWAHIRHQVFSPARSASARGAQPTSARLFRSSARPAKTRLSAGTPWFSSRPTKPPFAPAHALPCLAKDFRFSACSARLRLSSRTPTVNLFLQKPAAQRGIDPWAPAFGR